MSFESSSAVENPKIDPFRVKFCGKASAVMHVIKYFVCCKFQTPSSRHLASSTASWSWSSEGWAMAGGSWGTRTSTSPTTRRTWWGPTQWTRPSWPRRQWSRVWFNRWWSWWGDGSAGSSKESRSGLWVTWPATTLPSKPSRLSTYMCIDISSSPQPLLFLFFFMRWPKKIRFLWKKIFLFSTVLTSNNYTIIKLTISFSTIILFL